MRHTGSLTLSLLLVLLTLATPAMSGFEMNSSQCELDAEALVRNYFPGSSIVKTRDLESDLRQFWAEKNPDATPGCIAADFNADGATDYALLLIKENNGKRTEDLVILLGARDGGFKKMSLDTLTDRLGAFFLRPVLPSMITPWDKRSGKKTGSISIPYVGVELVLFEAAARVYYWRDGGFASIQTAD